VPVAGDIVRSDALVVCSHLTGHIASGWGAAIKNIAMGCTPRRGKLMQHSSMKPWIDAKECTACGNCVEWCPEDAITMDGTAHINEELCIGCGECLTVCPSFAVKFSWRTKSKFLQEKMAEFGLGVVKAVKDRALYLNFLLHMTADCDCMDKAQKAMAPDIGILASTDPVAIDRASVELFRKCNGKEITELSYPHLNGDDQLKHAVEIGLGTLDYEIREVKP
jgi:uncharacterized Fe-S center protein